MPSPILSTFVLMHLILTFLAQDMVIPILHMKKLRCIGVKYWIACSFTFVISHLSDCFGISSVLFVYLSILVPVSHCCNYYNFVQIYIPKNHQSQDSKKDSWALESPLWIILLFGIWGKGEFEKKKEQREALMSRACFSRINLTCLLSLLEPSLVTFDQFFSTLAIGGIQNYLSALSIILVFRIFLNC